MKKALMALIALVVVIGGCYYFFVMAPSADTVTLTSYSPGDYFVTNVKFSNRLLKAAPVLVVDDPALVETFTASNYIIRDTVIFILRDLTEEDIRATGVEETVREKLRQALNEKMETEGIVDVWFNDFVMQ